MTQVEFLVYCIDTMKTNKLKFAMFELSEIEEPERCQLILEADGYEVKIENQTFKVFWT